MPQLYHYTNHQLDKARWDACVSASPQYTVYGLAWYLDVVSPQWEGLVWQHHDEYLAVMPLPVQKRFGLKFVHQPLFCQFLDIYTSQPIERQLFERQLLACFRLTVSLCMGHKAQLINTQERVSHTLSLSKPYADLHRQYAPDRRLNLRRAERFGWRWVESTDIEPLIKLFAVYHEHQIEGGIHPSSYAVLRKLFEQIQQRNLGKLRYAVAPDGQIEAGCWWVYSGRRIIYLFNAASMKGRNGNARTWLLDGFLREHAEQTYLFDFESPMVPTIAAFYESFGAESSSYWRWSYNHLPAWLNALWQLKRRLA